jgi:Ca-activated chloride channel family protein
VLAFNNEIFELQPSGVVRRVREELLGKVDGRFASGGTALYQVTIQAIEALEAMRQEDLTDGEKRIYGVVLMSDGANDTDDGLTESHLLNVLPTGEASDEIHLYTIAYGDDAERTLLQKVANRTNGKYYKGSVEDIEDIYLLILSEF